MSVSKIKKKLDEKQRKNKRMDVIDTFNIEDMENISLVIVSRM